MGGKKAVQYGVVQGHSHDGKVTHVDFSSRRCPNGPHDEPLSMPLRKAVGGYDSCDVVDPQAGLVPVTTTLGTGFDSAIAMAGGNPSGGTPGRHGPGGGMAPPTEPLPQAGPAPIDGGAPAPGLGSRAWSGAANFTKKTVDFFRTKSDLEKQEGGGANTDEFAGDVAHALDLLLQSVPAKGVDAKIVTTTESIETSKECKDTAQSDLDSLPSVDPAAAPEVQAAQAAGIKCAEARLQDALNATARLENDLLTHIGQKGQRDELLSTEFTAAKRADILLDPVALNRMVEGSPVRVGKILNALMAYASDKDTHSGDVDNCYKLMIRMYAKTGVEDGLKAELAESHSDTESDVNRLSKDDAKTLSKTVEFLSRAIDSAAAARGVQKSIYMESLSHEEIVKTDGLLVTLALETQTKRFNEEVKTEAKKRAPLATLGSLLVFNPSLQDQAAMLVELEGRNLYSLGALIQTDTENKAQAEKIITGWSVGDSLSNAVVRGLRARISRGSSFNDALADVLNSDEVFEAVKADEEVKSLNPKRASGTTDSQYAEDVANNLRAELKAVKDGVVVAGKKKDLDDVLATLIEKDNDGAETGRHPMVDLLMGARKPRSQLSQLFASNAVTGKRVSAVNTNVLEESARKARILAEPSDTFWLAKWVLGPALMGALLSYQEYLLPTSWQHTNISWPWKVAISFVAPIVVAFAAKKGPTILYNIVWGWGGDRVFDHAAKNLDIRTDAAPVTGKRFKSARKWWAKRVTPKLKAPALVMWSAIKEAPNFQFWSTSTGRKLVRNSVFAPKVRVPLGYQVAVLLVSAWLIVSKLYPAVRSGVGIADREQSLAMIERDFHKDMSGYCSNSGLHIFSTCTLAEFTTTTRGSKFYNRLPPLPTLQNSSSTGQNSVESNRANADRFLRPSNPTELRTALANQAVMVDPTYLPLILAEGQRFDTRLGEINKALKENDDTTLQALLNELNIPLLAADVRTFNRLHGNVVSETHLSGIHLVKETHRELDTEHLATLSHDRWLRAGWLRQQRDFVARAFVIDSHVGEQFADRFNTGQVNAIVRDLENMRNYRLGDAVRESSAVRAAAALGLGVSMTNLWNRILLRSFDTRPIVKDDIAAIYSEAAADSLVRNTGAAVSRAASQLSHGVSADTLVQINLNVARYYASNNDIVTKEASISNIVHLLGQGVETQDVSAYLDAHAHPGARVNHPALGAGDLASIYTPSAERYLGPQTYSVVWEMRSTGHVPRVYVDDLMERFMIASQHLAGSDENLEDMNVIARIVSSNPMLNSFQVRLVGKIFERELHSANRRRRADIETAVRAECARLVQASRSFETQRVESIRGAFAAESVRYETGQIETEISRLTTDADAFAESVRAGGEIETIRANLNTFVANVNALAVRGGIIRENAVPSAMQQVVPVAPQPPVTIVRTRRPIGLAARGRRGRLAAQPAPAARVVSTNPLVNFDSSVAALTTGLNTLQPNRPVPDRLLIQLIRDVAALNAAIRAKRDTVLTETNAAAETAKVTFARVTLSIAGRAHLHGALARNSFLDRMDRRAIEGSAQRADFEGQLALRFDTTVDAETQRRNATALQRMNAFVVASHEELYGSVSALSALIAGTDTTNALEIARRQFRVAPSLPIPNGPNLLNDLYAHPRALELTGFAVSHSRFSGENRAQLTGGLMKWMRDNASHLVVAPRIRGGAPTYETIPLILADLVDGRMLPALSEDSSSEAAIITALDRMADVWKERGWYHGDTPGEAERQRIRTTLEQAPNTPRSTADPVAAQRAALVEAMSHPAPANDIIAEDFHSDAPAGTNPATPGSAATIPAINPETISTTTNSTLSRMPPPDPMQVVFAEEGVALVVRNLMRGTLTTLLNPASPRAARTLPNIAARRALTERFGGNRAALEQMLLTQLHIIARRALESAPGSPSIYRDWLTQAHLRASRPLEDPTAVHLNLDDDANVPAFQRFIGTTLLSRICLTDGFR